MLAEYPAIVEYESSPLPSPLFGEDDSFLSSCCHGDVEIEMPLNAGLDPPSWLNEEEDDVSSISASIQCSDTHEDDDLPYQLMESANPHSGTGQSTDQDSSIHSQGIDVDAEVEGLFGSVDYLNSSYLEAVREPVSLDVHDVLQEVEADFYLGGTEEVEDCNSNRSKVTEEHTPSASSTLGKRKKKTEDRGWSEMDAIEKEEVAEHLSSVLGSLLSPRERLEVMAMISQDNLDERNLVIESHMLNESTLAKLETYLERQEMTGEASDSELISEPERMRSYGNTTKRKCSSLPASPQHRGSFSERTPSLSVKKRSGQRKSLRGWKRRTRKDYRQASKERRSGLFHKEEVISLSRSIGEEDTGEEIDILA